MVNPTYNAQKCKFDPFTEDRGAYLKGLRHPPKGERNVNHVWKLYHNYYQKP